MFLNQAPHTDKSKPPYHVAKIESQLNSYASPGTKIEIGFPDPYEGSQLYETIGQQSMLNGLHHMMETPAIIKKIFWAAENGYDAVISSNTFDPGVDGGRLAVKIPVIGPLRTSVHAAAVLADRVGITVPLPPHVPYTWRLLRAMGMDRFVVDIKPIGVYMNAQERKAEIFDMTVGLINGLVKDKGAEIIVPLGGALIPYIVNPDDLAKSTGVQVLNTKVIAIRFAEMCVKFGMTQSAFTYPRADINYSDFTQSV
jgi:Asp/Glu/hydantoin racemase